ncbi:MAG: hypothetical protein ACE37F_23805 [Nannocystaceae bacterium]|nr:hypothetical protein [bacterium]
MAERGVRGLILSALMACACGGDDAAAGGEGSSGGAETTGTTSDSTSGSVSSGDGSTSDDASTSGSTTGEAVVDWPNLECDPLVPTYCGYPFPNNVFSVADASTPSGRRLALSRATMPPTNDGFQGEPDAFNDRDGFSPGGTILAHLEGAVATGLADSLHIADSLGDDSPTILLDVTTGERVPHFAELDVNAPAEEASLMIQPAVTLEYTHRYIVAVRGMVDEGGSVVAASEAFAALRDGTPSDDAAVEDRRPLYIDIFAQLQDAGVAREDLQLAWDFTVASREDTNGRVLAMRDAALEAVGDGPTYEILSVDEDVSESIFRRIEGEIEVPLFLDDPGPGGVLTLDGDGVPVANATARYGFTAMVPYSAQDAPAPGVLFGHGLFGSRSQVEASAFGELSNAANITFVGVDWIGMSSEDPALVGLIVSNGNLGQFRTLPDRLQQSLVNFLLVTRMLRTSIVDDPAFTYEGQSMLDGDTTYYYGGSQGGIMGASYMALATDVTRGVLAVPGQSYNLLLERSVNFDSFADVINSTYPQAFDRQMLLGLVQLLWDRAEPSGLSRHIIEDTLPGTPSHQVLLLDAIGDHQVTTLGAHVMARTIGVPLLAENPREVWGLEQVEGPLDSALVEYDFGLPPEPLGNEPMREGEDPHGQLTDVPAAVQTATHYFLQGEAVNFCDGVCDPG